MSEKLTKNERAWQEIFDEEDVLSIVEREGSFSISSEKINRKREARLMTKFDHRNQLPKLFRENKLSIQPVSRGNYIIGNFSSYFPLPEDRDLPEIQYLELPPNIETISSQSISSESEAIVCAYLSGMIADLLEEPVCFTVFGRKSTGTFNYEIINNKTRESHEIRVVNSQCEIDGGFEGASKFAIIEAKCQYVDDFIIRQLYYPYRLWESKAKKDIVPIFLSFSNNIFTFYIFEFSNLCQYNSIQLKSVHRYCIGQYEIELSDVRQISSDIENLEDDTSQTFPQADKFARVIDLLDKLYLSREPLTKEEITSEYAFDVRQTDYYVSAGVYLGFFERLAGGSRYTLTERGLEIVRLDPQRKNLELVKAILSHRIFNEVLKEYLSCSQKPNRERIIAIMNDNLVNLNLTTMNRRAQTVEKWIDWILQLTSS